MTNGELGYWQRQPFPGSWGFSMMCENMVRFENIRPLLLILGAALTIYAVLLKEIAEKVKRLETQRGGSRPPAFSPLSMGIFEMPESVGCMAWIFRFFNRSLDDSNSLRLTPSLSETIM